MLLKKSALWTDEDAPCLEVRRLAYELEDTQHSQEVLEEVCGIVRLFSPRLRAHSGQSLPCASLRAISRENWKVRDDEGSPSSPRTDVKELISKWQAELSDK